MASQLLVKRTVITAGPSKWDLMLALFDGAKPSGHSVIFDAKVPMRPEELKHHGRPCIHAAITGLIRKVDTTDDEWEFTGYCGYAGQVQQSILIHGEYSTKTRKGWFEGIRVQGSDWHPGAVTHLVVDDKTGH